MPELLENRKADTIERQKSETIARLETQARQRMAASQAEAVADFIGCFYANVAPEDLLSRPETELYALALSLWQFAQERKVGEAKIRVFTPNIADHGWHAGHSVVEIVNDDMPFLVDSLTVALDERGIGIHLLIHPVLSVLRDKRGQIIPQPAHDLAGEGTALQEYALQRESFISVEIDERSHPQALAALTRAIAEILEDVRACVTDWPQMRDKMQVLAMDVGSAPLAELAEDALEAQAFLLWLLDNHFTFMGYRDIRYEIDTNTITPTVVEKSGLGILRDDKRSIFAQDRIQAAQQAKVRAYLLAPRLIDITKANIRATVHRSVHMDVIAIKQISPQGQTTGERVFVGLFTSASYSQSPHTIPFLRRKVAYVLAQAGFDPRGHAGKALAHILDSYPRDELFQISPEDLSDIALRILRLQDRKRIALFVRQDSYGRFVSCLVYIPRDRLDTELRQRFGRVLATAYEGEVSAYYLALEEGVLARVHYIIKTKPGFPIEVDVKALEATLRDAARRWEDRLQGALIESLGEERGLMLAHDYARAFPTSYGEQFSAHNAVYDISQLEQARQHRRLMVSLYRPLEANSQNIHLKLYHPGGPIALTRVLPILENMGLHVVAEVPYEIKIAQPISPPAPSNLPEENRLWLHDFHMHSPFPIILSDIKTAFEVAFYQIWIGEMENDGFNRLILRAGLDGRAVMVLRAYGKYLRQIQFPYGQESLEHTLGNHPHIANLLFSLFSLRLAPTLFPSIAQALPPLPPQPAQDTPSQDLVSSDIKTRQNQEATLEAQLEAALDAVANLEEDLILRRFWNVIKASLRCNFWQKDQAGLPKSYLAIKFASQDIDALPQPRPLYEIFVYSPRVEAIHLRGGKVSRGGIRWSDRREDFRTEILGLMKAQMVKNAVIVPLGSKGGFVVKRPPPQANRDTLQAEAIACYEIFIAGLLDLTDTLQAKDCIAPPDLLRRDLDDPYLVVAADKGTASFSDNANTISKRYGFWLGDAFASGGSAGYDHKKMAITARGAWEAVKRHFREIGIDCQRQPIQVVGVGDMSGDVFGNGMLQSPSIKLIAAFDHRHIFIDPDPDPTRSYEERLRIFQLTRSSWADYAPNLLSPGGGIYPRSLKQITLSPAAMAALGSQQSHFSPAELIQTILKAPIDLLWFGGIGTYVKAPQESHVLVGDKANDGVRVDAHHVRAKVIGEGANLAMTPKARILYAQLGGRLNSDAIDNSAGVDCSDHEVNIKILLGAVMEAGEMTEIQRNRLLADMTDEVARLVLTDNYLQTQALTVEQARGRDMLPNHARLMDQLARMGLLNITLEALPDGEEITRREQAGESLTRPELALLLAYSKIHLYDQLLASQLPDEPHMVEDLCRYFPTPLRQSQRPHIEKHRLRREIIATAITNSMVNRVGPCFVTMISEKTAQSADNVARAYIAARDALELRSVWRAVEALDLQIAAELQTQMLSLTQQALERAVPWLLAHNSGTLNIAELVNNFRPPLQQLAGSLSELLDRQSAQQRLAAMTPLIAGGVPDDLAQRIATLPILAAGLDIVRLAHHHRCDELEIARLYFAIADATSLPWLRLAVQEAHRQSQNSWQRQALLAVEDDLYALQAELCAHLLTKAPQGGSADVKSWLASLPGRHERYQRLIQELRNAEHLDLAMLTIACRQLRNFITH
jgi:glutamate dehydrogenase